MESPSPDPHSGITLHGRVVVGARIGGDGSVSVYTGRDNVTGQPVTVTLLDPRMAADQTTAHAFLGRVQALAGISAPNLVRVLGDGRDGDHVYVVTEDTPGETLADVLGGGDQGLRYSPHMALSIIADVLAALRETHDEGVVHGALTPDDVVLDDDGGVTVTGLQLFDIDELTPRTDVHAVGTLLYSLMTGTLDIEEGASLRPSAVVPGLPPDLDMLVANATEPNPRYRPRDAGQYLNLVEQVLRSLPQPSDERGETQPIPVVGAAAAAGSPSHGPAPDGAGEGGTPLWRRRTPILVLAGVLVLTLFAAGWALVSDESEELPDLAGFSPQTAEAELAALDLELTYTYEDAYSDEIEPGEIAETDPAAGTELEGGEEVLLSVSVGAQHVEIPDVVGGTENEALETLREAGFTDVDVEQEHSADEEPGTVLSSEPEVGEKGDREEPVTILVSEGVIVPDLIGMGQAEAAEALEGLDLSYSVAEAPSDTVAEGAVSGQDPEPGAIVPEDGAVTLTVSTGPEEEEEEPEDDDDDDSEEGDEGREDPGDDCSGDAWSPRKVYDDGDVVHYEGREYEARWWIQGLPPDAGEEWGAWSDRGPC
ncbi:PASTA domain-containing protein [Nocardiopsis oceani]